MEIVTSELKAKVLEQFEQSDKLIEEQAELIDELYEKLKIAEKVCYAANRYILHINSPVATGWDELIKALSAWTAEKALKEMEAVQNENRT